MDVQIQFVQQPTDATCAHSCLAMVTGIPVERLMERFGDRGLSLMDETVVLTECWILPIDAPLLGPYRSYVGAAFATIVSRNVRLKTHRVVMEIAASGAITIHDPNRSRHGRNWIEPDAVITGAVSLEDCMRVTLLHPMPNHRGATERLAAYAARRGA